jgi:hypothetical protein
MASSTSNWDLPLGTGVFGAGAGVAGVATDGYESAEEEGEVG